MPVEITIPRLGWSMEEGTFVSWLKNEGDKVKSGDVLFSLESDKVTMDVESLDNGTLHIPPGAPNPGDVVTIGQRIGYLLAEGEATPKMETAGDKGHEVVANPPSVSAPVAETRVPYTDEAQAIPPPAVSKGVAGSQDDGPRISPRALGVAQKLGIDISSVLPRPGSKRIVEADVRRAYEGITAAPSVSPVPVAPASRKDPAGSVRRTIAARMEESFRAPHFYVHAEADASSFVKLREEMLSVIEKQYHIRLTYNDFLIKALALTLRALPTLNGYWNQGEIVSRNAVNIGLAVQVNDSLMVPVIRDADRLTIGEIARTRHDLVDRCNRSTIRLTDMEDGSITLSNLGPFGVDRFQAILNPPQSMIVAVGRIAKRPFVDGETVVARMTAPLSVSVDHRVVDGVAAAAFLRGVVELVQSPFRLVLPQAPS